MRWSCWLPWREVARKKQILHYFITLHAGTKTKKTMILSKEAVLTQAALLSPSLILGEFLNVLIQQYELFWTVVVLNQRSLIHIAYTYTYTYAYSTYSYSLVTFYLLFAWVTTNFESLARRQLYSPDANHWVFFIPRSVEVSL